MKKIILSMMALCSVSCVSPTLNSVEPEKSSPTPTATPVVVAPALVQRHFLYVADVTSSTGGVINRYSINDATGVLTHLGQTTGVFNNYYITSSPDQKFLLATGGGSELVNGVNEAFSRVSSFSIDQSTGDLTLINSVKMTTGATNANPTQVTVHPSGKFVYVSDGRYQPAGGIYMITLSPTGVLGSVTNTLTGGLNYPHGISFSANGMVAVASNFAGYDPGTGTDRAGFGKGDTMSAYSVNLLTGALTPAVGPSRYGAFSATSANMGDARYSVFDPNKNVVYVMDANSTPPRVSSWTYDPNTGALAIVGSARSTNAAGTGGWGINKTPNGKFLFTTVRNAKTISSYDATSVTNIPVFLGDASTTGNRPNSITVHPTANYIYVTHQSSADINAFTYDTASGLLTPAITPTYMLPVAPGSGGAMGQSSILVTTLGI
jgi:6-phosphogluconolactonase (cycloisomerase 2 family)